VMRLEDPESYVSELRSAADALDNSADAEVALLADTVRLLSDAYPTDPGVLAALLMNRVKLQPGEAMFLDAGNLHAYLHGAGIEIMANSDNVMRGGLTSKHVDVEELVSILDFRPIADDRIEPGPVSPGVVRYPTPATEFALWRLTPSGSSVEVPATASGRALVVTDGSVTLSSDDSTVEVKRGQAAFLEAGTSATASGQGMAFLAGPGL
jgi:mannose-6-phosphate isomerase